MQHKSTTNKKRRSRWATVAESSDKVDGPVNDSIQVGNIAEGAIISIDGRQHPVDILYANQPVADYVEASVDTVLRLHFDMAKDDGDILCFLPTGEEIDRAISIAQESIQSFRKKSQGRMRAITFLPLYGALPYHMQSKIFHPKLASETARRVIFATNIAETSVTVPHITSVIDCGFVKLPYFDTETGFDRLVVSPVSQASAKQRAGRAGRIKAGKCYRLYTEAAMAKDMALNTSPEILRTNLSSFILTLKVLGIHNILSFDLMSVPSVPALIKGLESLFILGAIDDQTHITNLGNQMAEFPTEVRVSKMILKSITFGCPSEILCVASALQVRALFYQPRTQIQQMDYDSAMGNVMDPSGDHVTFANLLLSNDDANLTANDCKERFINYLALKRAVEIRSQLNRFLKRRGKIVTMDSAISPEDRSVAIRKCVTAGFFSNTAKLGNDGNYYSLRGKNMITISKSSALYKYGRGSEYIIFGETYDGVRGGIEARSCSSIEGKWLRDLSPHYWT